MAVLDELVVTATRQEEPINGVPLSISAQTQRTLDEQGIHQLADLQGFTPALSIDQNAPGVAFITIRGIQNNGQGAAVTGFYLDDTSLTKRGAYGCPPCTGNGTPLPPVFDLERVEVLRGPQGTLFGSSSQGGTVRYITPRPSLHDYSAYARAEASSTADGAPSVEAGAAVGGPIVAGRLGFRASVYQRNTGGWLDYRNRTTGQVFARDANDDVTRMFRGAATLALTDETQVTAAYFKSSDHSDSRSDTYFLDTLAPVTEPEACFSAAGAQLPACTAPEVAYRRQALTLPRLSNMGSDTSLHPFLLPATTNLGLASLTIDQQFGRMSFKSITSYVDDQTKVQNFDGGALIRGRATNAGYAGIEVRNLPAYAGLPNLPQDFLYGRFYVDNRRHALTQEFRLSSPAEERPISWVAGLFYSVQRNTQSYDNTYPSLDVLLGSLYGLTAQQYFRNGAGPYILNGAAVGFDAKYQTLRDTEFAAFGEINYWITKRIRATLGVRLSYLEFLYTQLHYGPAYGGNDSGLLPGGITPPTRVVESPVAPKFAVEYHLSNDDMVYGTIAKGFRAGGVNGSIPEAVCAQGLSRFGETVNSLPPTYGSDTVWSYEAGAKLRFLDGRAVLNGSAYRIEWSDIQTSVLIPPPCGIPFTTNGGKARSQGFELEGQARLFDGMSVNVAVARTDAAYTKAAVALGQPGYDMLPAAVAGQQLAVPPWTLEIGLRQDLPLSPKVMGFARLDWRRVEGMSGTGAQTVGSADYSPTARFPSTERTDLRIGVINGDMEASLFVINLLNSRAGPVTGGYGSCPTPANGGDPTCAGGLYVPYFSVRPVSPPRQIGFRLVYRR